MQTEQRAIEKELKELKPPSGHCVNMINAIEDFIAAVEEIAEALIDFLTSIACLVIDAALATLGGILDVSVMCSFSCLFLVLLFVEQHDWNSR